MPEAVRARPAVSQQFGSAVVSDGSRLFQGIVQGDLHLNQRPETPPKPTAVIPFNRDTDFVQRDTILDQIHRLCSEPASRTALVGLGGVGKSQIAIDSAARYEQSFRDIADYLKLPERENPQSNIFQLIYNWLRGEKSGKWVIILDNVDAAGFLLHNPAEHGGQRDGSDSQGQPLVSYLPSCQHGSILITTRSKHAALTLAEERDTIAVDPMHQAEAIALAQKKLGKTEKQEDIVTIQSLVKTLEYMPLAIVQATAHISQKAPRCSIRQYLEKFTRSDRKRATLLDYEGRQLRRDREAKNSIIITWQISFDHIRQTRPSAADLLSLMCFCDRQGIPESLLRTSDEKEGATGRPDQYRRSPALDGSDSDQEPSDEDVESDSSIDDQFEKDVSSLRDYSFISAVEDGKTFEMHSLVQLATRRWLEFEGQQETWKSEFIRRLNAQLPTGAVFKGLASILYKAAWYLWLMGQGHEAQKMAEGAKKLSMKIFGRAHEESQYAIEMLGHAHNLQGHWKAAEKLFVEVMEIRKQKLGADHPSTLTSMANLASTFSNQGRWEEAEKLFVEVMETRKQKLGADHPDTLTSMNNLAYTSNYYCTTQPTLSAYI
ncbi:hypothetical protein PG995_006315 [Apiospora arundinis]